MAVAHCEIILRTLYVFSIMLKCSVDCAGNELFASVLELEELWQNGNEVIRVIERVLEDWDEAPHVFEL